MFNELGDYAREKKEGEGGPRGAFLIGMEGVEWRSFMSVDLSYAVVLTRRTSSREATLDGRSTGWGGKKKEGKGGGASWLTSVASRDPAS